MLADVALHRFEGGGVKLHTTKYMLLSRRKTRMARRLHHVHDDGLFRFAGAVVSSHADGQVKVQSCVVHAGSINRIGADLLERHPVAEQDRSEERRVGK